MQGDIVSSDQPATPSPLGDRLDASIGEASSGIGALLSELVRRSLKAGVSDVGESLAEYAEEQVEAAIGQQMPAIAEAADEVAKSTSRRVVREAVDEFTEQSAKQQESLESKINDTRDLAVEGKETSQQKIDELRIKARKTWQKLREEFATVHDAHKHLQKEHDQLVQTLAQVSERHQKQIEAAEERLSALLSVNERLQERIELLEQPRGIQGLMAKFRGRKKKPAPEPTQQAEDATETPEMEA